MAGTRSVVRTLSDEALLTGLGSGDPDAAAAFMDRFQRRVFGMTLSILQDRQAAEEAAQEAFVRAWRFAAVYQGTSGDRRLADSYRAVLAQGHGSFFTAAPLRSPAGILGSAYGYQGQPSWLFATLNQPTAQPEHYKVQLITRDGRHLSLGETVFGGTHRTWGAQIPVNLTQVSQLRFEAASGQSTITADLNPQNPWSPG